MLTIFVRISFVCMMFLCISSQSAASCFGNQDAKQTYSVAIVPQFPASEIYTQWSLLLTKIGLQTGECFNLLISNSIPEFESLLFKGDFDFAFMNPYHQVIAKRTGGYLPLVRDDKNKLIGIVVVRKDSPFQSLKDLEHAVVAFPAPNAFAASLLIRAILAREHVDITAHYLKNHTNVYRSVLVGDAQAGGGVNSTFIQEPEDLRHQLRVIFQSPLYAPHPFSAHPRVPESVREDVANAIIKLKVDPSNQVLLSKIQMSDPVMANWDVDYAPLGKLGIDQLVIFKD